MTVRLLADKPTTAQLWLPSVIAIAVVVLGGFIQWGIARRQWKEQGQALDKQLDAQRGLAEKQLEAQRELTEKQIDASLRASARLRWIDSVRRLAGDLLNSSAALGSTLSSLDSWRKVAAKSQDRFNLEQRQKYHEESLRQQLRVSARSRILRLHLDWSEPHQEALADAGSRLEARLSDLSAMHDDLPADFASSIGVLSGELHAATIFLIRHYSEGIHGNR